MLIRNDGLRGGQMMGITGVDYSGLGYGYDWRMKSPDETTYGAGRNIDDGRDGNQEIGRNPDDAKRIGIGSNVDGTERKVNDGNGDHAESVDSKVDKDGKKKECQTCKNRKYIDGSDEANVSFKSAAHVSPEAAASAVRAHEGQHVSNAYSKASENDGKVISASVRIHTAICPECGRSYVSGGVTNTQIKYYNESNPYQKDLKAADGIKARGERVDMGV